MRLLAACKAAGFEGVQDAELAEAVVMSFKDGQREGLFLLRVPEALAVIRKRPPPEASVGEHWLKDAAKHLAACAEDLRARGEPYRKAAEKVADVLAVPGGARRCAEGRRSGQARYHPAGGQG